MRLKSSIEDLDSYHDGLIVKHFKVLNDILIECKICECVLINNRDNALDHLSVHKIPSELPPKFSMYRNPRHYKFNPDNRVFIRCPYCKEESFFMLQKLFNIHLSIYHKDRYNDRVKFKDGED